MSYMENQKILFKIIKQYSYKSSRVVDAKIWPQKLQDHHFSKIFLSLTLFEVSLNEIV